MKVCHVITRLIVGGAQENTLLTCKGLAERGYEVILATGPETGPEGSLWERARTWGVNVMPLASLRRAVQPFYDLRAYSDLIRLFRTHRPVIVHTHSSKAGIVARFAAAAANVPIVVHTIHGMSFNRTQSTRLRWAFRMLERWAARHTDAFVTVADAMMEQSIEAGIAPREKFRTIRSGMVTERYAPDPQVRREVRQEWNIADDRVVVGTIARLFSHKGYEQILLAMPEAVRRVDRLHFVWVGDGANRREYERRLESMGFRGRVHLTGLAPPEAIPRLLQGFDMLVHASQWEGLPRAVVQALLCEVPAISFDIDGAPEVVVPDQTGILVPLHDLSALADAIVALARDGERRKALGRQGRAWCLTQFDWRTMVDQIDELYRRLVKTKLSSNPPSAAAFSESR